ncbi:hypothetical protein RHSP_21270 [Rhizobium freirei PRF 81]|uniref:Uncharacterized protein n=1 Tax=Rhizobium freirei PRF 81 TaxID=363754 RepID=N6UU61_9HYPH|nr:hypothetical protein RHSP_21270 [Rhizobium freirei PRF 81]
MVHDRNIFGAADIVQPGVFRADAGIVEASRDRMTFFDLAVAVLQQIGAVAVQHAGRTGGDGCAMLIALQTLAAGFDADDLDAFVIEEGMEDADGVRAAADGRDDEIRQAAFGLQYLRAGFRADHGLEIADHFRIGMRAGGRADQVIGIIDIGDPVAQRLVHGVLQRAAAGGHRDNLGAQELHAENVRRLALHIGRAHVDDAGQAEAGSNRRRGNAMLAGTGLGDDAGLAHALGEQDLTDAIVDLVRTRVVQLFALEIDFCAAEFCRQALGKVKRARSTDVMRAQRLQLSLKGRIVLRLVPFLLQIQDQRHQRFGYETTTVNAETAVLIGAGAEGIGFRRLVHFLLPAAGSGRHASAKASKNWSILPRSFTPGALSTAEERSTPVALVDARARATLSLFTPPDSM